MLNTNSFSIDRATPKILNHSPENPHLVGRHTSCSVTEYGEFFDLARQNVTRIGSVESLRRALTRPTLLTWLNAGVVSFG
jgi:hypothetical protein